MVSKAVGGAVTRNLVKRSLRAIAREILNENIQLQAGFMKTYQQRQNGVDFNSRDILRFSIYHNLDFYYKKNKQKTNKQTGRGGR